MRNLFLIAGMAAAVAAPSFTVIATPAPAEARTYCEKAQNNKRVAGTVAGGALGALAGTAIAGRGSNTEGAIIGGIAGAVVGNQLSKSRTPCPAGYVQRSYADPAPASRRATAVSTNRAGCRWQDQSYRDSNGEIVRRQVEVCR